MVIFEVSSATLTQELYAAGAHFVVAAALVEPWFVNEETGAEPCGRTGQRSR
jgi:hypothetical protein